MADFKSKVKDINDILTNLDRNEKKIILKFIIMTDLKLYTEVLFEEQRRLEKECGLRDVEAYEEYENNFDSGCDGQLKDGYLGYVDIDGVKHEYEKEEIQ